MNRWLCSLLVVIAVVLAACGTPTPAWFAHEYQGVPTGYTAPAERTVDTAVWEDPGQIAVVSWGSSSCPKLPIHLATSAGHVLTITLSSGAPPPGVSCTADYAPTTGVIWVPDTIDQTQPVDITIVDGSDRQTVTLPPGGSPA